MAKLPKALVQESAPSVGVGKLLDEKLKADYLGGPSVRGWSKVKSYMICDRLYYNSSILKLQPRKKSPALEIGTLFHACMAAHYFTGGQKTYDPLNAIKDDAPETVMEVARLLRAYFNKYQLQEAAEWDIRAVEHEVIGSFTAQLPGMEAPHTTHISTRFDLIIAKKSPNDPPHPYGPHPNGCWIVDHKCIPGNTSVLTKYGYVSVQDLAIAFPNGAPIPILAVENEAEEPFRLCHGTAYMFASGFKQIFRLRGHDSGPHFIVDLSADHPVKTEKRGWVCAAELQPKERILYRDDSGTFKWVSVFAEAAHHAPCWDFYVPKHHAFVAGKLVVHNCHARITRDLIEGYGMDGQFLLMAHLWRQQKLEETLGKFNGYIINIITKTNEVECRRIEVALQDRDIDRFVASISPQVVELDLRLRDERIEDPNYWPMNFAVCKSPYGYGPCPFFELCRSHGANADLYEIRT